MKLAIKSLICFVLVCAFFSLSGNNVITSTSYGLSSTSNFNARFDGAVTSDFVGWQQSLSTDINGNGIPDLIIGSRGSDYNSRSASGSIYIVYDTLLNASTSICTLFDMASSSTYTVRLDGPTASSAVGFRFQAADLDGDGKNELILSANGASLGGTSNGGVFIIPNSIIGEYTTAGNILDLSNAANYSYMLYGASNSDSFGRYLTTGDVDGDGGTDIVVGASGTDYNSRSNSGSVYVIKNTLISDTTLGTTIDMATTSNFSTRFDGPLTTSFSTFSQMRNVSDFDNNGRDELNY